MSPFSLRYRELPDDAERDAVMRVVHRRGGSATWRPHAPYHRTYALIEGCEAADRVELTQTTQAAVFEGPIIALAVFPSALELLSSMRDALGGAGRPDGVTDCETVGDALIVEWNLERSGAALILGLIDVELRRMRAGRRVELLTPLPLAWWTRIAAEGLQAPQIAEDRVLESLLEKSGVAD